MQDYISYGSSFDGNDRFFGWPPRGFCCRPMGCNCVMRPPMFPGTVAPPIGTYPTTPVPPIGTMPPVKPVPPIGTLPPTMPRPPVGSVPPQTAVPLPHPITPEQPIGTYPTTKPHTIQTNPHTTKYPEATYAADAY